MNDLDSIDFKGKKIDYIFTTVPLNKKYVVPVYEINLFIDASEIVNYRKMFENGDEYAILNYYSSKLFISHLKAETREGVINKMCQRIDECGILPSGFYDAVMVL